MTNPEHHQTLFMKDNLHKPLIKRMPYIYMYIYIYSYTGNRLQAAAHNGPKESSPSSVHHLKNKKTQKSLDSQNTGSGNIPNSGRLLLKVVFKIQQTLKYVN